ncbi:phage major tail tube protein [Paenibacillus sp. NRS-1780]|uniref:phage major tail tube protein n=1 Tax=Paenibacillus sp. NRS-1780 TaxID=3233904 RepID=UPI003D299FD5
MAKNIPVKLVGMAIYANGSSTDFSTGDITLPNFTPLTDTLSGAGILGELDIPTPGHYGSLELGIAWRTIDKDAFGLIGTKLKSLEIRGAFTEFSTTSGELETRAVKIVVKGIGKGIDLGTFAQNATTGTATTLEVTYIKVFIDGVAVIELDKLNSVSRINGVDDLFDINKALGKA